MSDTAQQRQAAPVGEQAVMNRERVHLWRRRVRSRLPEKSEFVIRFLMGEHLPLDTVQKDALLGWVAQAYAVGDCLREFESEAAEEASAGTTPDACAQNAFTVLGERADELIGDFDNSVQPLLDTLEQSGVDAPKLTKRIDKLKNSLAELRKASVRNEIFSPAVCGIALSGGGVRSAAFNLGVLEALRVKERWADFDYMSTVSGGGYIGSALSFHNAKDRSCFPFFDRKGSRRSRRITWMRAHGSYLNRGKEVNTLTLAASIIKGVGLNVLFIVPLLIAVMWLLTLGCRESWRGLSCVDASGLLSQPFAPLLIVVAAIAIVFTFQASKSRRTPDKFRLTVAQVVGGLVIAAAFVAGVYFALRTNAGGSERGELAQYLLGQFGTADGLVQVGYSLALLPPLLLGFLTLVQIVCSRCARRLGRMPFVVPEFLAWTSVGGTTYLILQALPQTESYPPGHLLFLLVGIVLLVRLLVNFLFMAVLSSTSGRFTPYEQRTFSVQYGDLLGLALIFLAVGLIPKLDALAVALTSDDEGILIGGMSVTGAITTAVGWMLRQIGNERRGYVAFLLRFGLIALLVAGLLGFYRLALAIHTGDGGGASGLVVLFFALFAWLFAAIVADLNYMSMHRYYRNRLADAFLTDPVVEDIIDAVADRKADIQLEAAAYLATYLRHSSAELEDCVECLIAESGKDGPIGTQPIAAAGPESGERHLLARLLGRIRWSRRPRIGLGDVMHNLSDPAYDVFVDAYKKACGGTDGDATPNGLGHLVAHSEFCKASREALVREAADSKQRVDYKRAQKIVNKAQAKHRGMQLSDELPVCEIDAGRSGSPYHLLNTNLVLIGSRDEKYRSRYGDSFLLSPGYFGSGATGWVAADSTDNRSMDIGTAMAISGAAVDPNTGATLSMPLRILMTLLNVRLGFWWLRPGADVGLLKRLWSESWTVLVVREMFGLMNEDSDHVRLSDGGHFENLGLYELIRRRCDRIVVCDAGADPEHSFADLARVAQRVRVDFGAEIDIDVQRLKPSGSDLVSTSPFVKGKVRYSPPHGAATPQEADLWYIKTNRFSGLKSVDVAGYATAHPKFPDETTADQFFSEDQFEAYRELGFESGERLADGMASG